MDRGAADLLLNAAHHQAGRAAVVVECAVEAADGGKLDPIDPTGRTTPTDQSASLKG
jgi:hypothetical protein